MLEENKDEVKEEVPQNPESESPETIQSDTVLSPQSTPVIPAYRYHWNYQTQATFDTAQRKKRKRKGIFLYAAIMTTAFLLCFAVLIGAIFFYGGFDSFWSNQGLMTTTDVFELVVPSTVIIQVHSRGYLVSQGTGFFVRSDGYIVTNYHVISSGNTFYVYSHSGNSYIASLVGQNKDYDLAVLKIDGTGFPSVTIGNSDTVLIGETAIAIGNPSGVSGAWSVSEGIISATNRPVSSSSSTSSSQTIPMFQFDAPVNPGNSGGPLCNSNGEVIGVITSKLEKYEGIAFAIPINAAISVVNNIIQG